MFLLCINGWQMQSVTEKNTPHRVDRNRLLYSCIPCCCLQGMDVLDYQCLSDARTSLKKYLKTHNSDIKQLLTWGMT